MKSAGIALAAVVASGCGAIVHESARVWAESGCPGAVDTARVVETTLGDRPGTLPIMGDTRCDVLNRLGLPSERIRNARGTEIWRYRSRRASIFFREGYVVEVIVAER